MPIVHYPPVINNYTRIISKQGGTPDLPRGRCQLWEPFPWLREGKKIKGPKASILLARPAGFEPATSGFVVRYSIQLSYGRLYYSFVIPNHYRRIHLPGQITGKCWCGWKNGGEGGIRTRGTVLAAQSLSRRPPSADSATSPRQVFIGVNWRKGWDSNPRDPQRPNGFQDRLLQPLGHPSHTTCTSVYHEIYVIVNIGFFAILAPEAGIKWGPESHRGSAALDHFR